MSRINPVTGQREYKPGDTDAPVYFDYDRQAWVKDGVYQDCGHPQPGAEYLDAMAGKRATWRGCDCYGRAHAGEQAPDSASEYLRQEAAARQQFEADHDL